MFEAVIDRKRATSFESEGIEFLGWHAELDVAFAVVRSAVCTWDGMSAALGLVAVFSTALHSAVNVVASTKPRNATKTLAGRITVKLSGRAEAPPKRRGRRLSSRARGA